MSRRSRYGLSAFGAAALLAVAPATPGGGTPGCPWDCGPPLDGVVGIQDFLTTLVQWGFQGTSCDLGLGAPGVGIEEFLDVLISWGPCPSAANDECAGAESIDRLDEGGTVTVPFDLATATASPANSTCLGGANAHRDLWYCLRNLSGSKKEVVVRSDVPGLLIEVTAGCACPQGAMVACGTNSITGAAFTMQAGAQVGVRLLDPQDLPADDLQGQLIVENDPSGACCLANGTCTQGTAPECATASGFYQGDGTVCASADCFPCPDPATTPENEPNCGLPSDTVNGGCNVSPAVFSTISCGQTRCGTVAGTATSRDTDWYRVVIPGIRRITWTVTVEFPAVIGIPQYQPANEGSGNCAHLTGFLNPTANIAAGQTGSVTACLPGGTYFLFVAPQAGQVLACGKEYFAQVTCVTGCAGACCFSNGTCANNGTQGQCANLGGFFQGEGSTCSTGLCPPGCGNAAAGSCCSVHAAPGCADHNCCQAVCQFDAFCCIVAWDATCVSHTQDFPALCGCGG
jgi:hypothetical protein